MLAEAAVAERRDRCGPPDNSLGTRPEFSPCFPLFTNYRIG